MNRLCHFIYLVFKVSVWITLYILDRSLLSNEIKDMTKNLNKNSNKIQRVDRNEENYVKE
jgi:hypothetical protein